jgi:hypothetical protein
MPLAGVALADENEDPHSEAYENEDPPSTFTAFTINGSTGPLTVNPGDTLNWSASAVAVVRGQPGGPVPDGYEVKIIQNGAEGCSSNINLDAATRDTRYTTGGTATGSFTAPTTPGTYFYWPRHDSQRIGGDEWGTVNGYNPAGGNWCIQVTVRSVTGTSSITTEIHREPDDTPVNSVTMGATIHDQATVTTTVNPIPAGSSVTFQFFNNAKCSGEPSSEEDVALTGGSFSESVESSSYLVRAADIATGLSYKAVFKSGDTSKVPDAEGDCEPLQVLSSIVAFYYEVISGPDASSNPGTFNCTLPASEKGKLTPCPDDTTAASITKGETNTYRLHVVVANYTGVPIREKVQGGLTAAPGVQYGELTVRVHEDSTVSGDCGSARINISRSGEKKSGTTQNGNVVTWTIDNMEPGLVCELTVEITVKFSGTGLQPLTSSWSEFQCLLDGPNKDFCEKSPYTDSLMVIVS